MMLDRDVRLFMLTYNIYGHGFQNQKRGVNTVVEGSKASCRGIQQFAAYKKLTLTYSQGVVLGHIKLGPHCRGWRFDWRRTPYYIFPTGTLEVAGAFLL